MVHQFQRDKYTFTNMYYSSDKKDTTISLLITEHTKYFHSHENDQASLDP